MDNQFINLTLLDEQSFDVLLGFSTQLLAGILTLIIGFWLAGRAGRLIIESLNKIDRLDNTVVPLLGALVRYAGMTLTLVVALGKFGVETTSIIAVLGAAGLAIGLALQGTLSNVAAGLMLVFVDIMKELPMTLLLRPFDFETLATHTYQFAKDEMLEQAALPALMIVMSGLIPVILMSAMLRRYR